MADIVAFWIVALVIGASALPVAFVLFRRFLDGGAGLAFALGLVLSGYGYFILRTLDVLPPGRGGFVLAVGLLGVVGAVTARRDSRFRATALRVAAPVLMMAGVFTLFFFGYASFRSYQSSIGGTEQPMDLLYLNAALTSPDYPPQDPWLAGEPAAYYYFGYVQTAVLTGASGVPASTGYNLGLAAVFASSATAVLSLALTIGRWVLGSRPGAPLAVAGVAGIALLLFAGSLIGPFELAAAHGAGDRALFETFGAGSALPCEPGQAGECYRGSTEGRTDAWYPTEYWFWWRGSRVIPGTITEFPFFSFLLGDLHPHVMAIPVVLLALGLAAATWRGRSVLSHRTLLAKPLMAVLLAVLLGALAFQNTWDVITFAGIFAVAVAARNLRAVPPDPAADDHPGPDPVLSLRRVGASAGAWRATAGFVLPLALLAVVLYLPWWLDFDSQAGGIYPHVGEGTLPNHAFLQFGTMLVAASVLFAWAMRVAGARPMGQVAWLALWLPVLPLLAWGPLAAWHGDLSTGLESRGAGGWATLAIYGAVTFGFASAFGAFASRRHPAAIPAGFATVAALLLYGAELFLVRDVFFGSVPRLNTVFKLSYQAWILLAVAGAVGAGLLAAAVRDHGRRGLPFALPVGALVVLSLVYAFIAVPNRTNGFEGESNIDGLAGLARSNPAEFALVQWVNENVPPSRTILEASGRQWSIGEDGPTLANANVDYSDAGRVSSRTGRATPIGWYFHEIQWRGDSPSNHDTFRARQDEVDAIYMAPSAEDAMERLRALDVSYVVLGSIELSRYPADAMPDFDAFLDRVFESGDVRVYRVPVSDVMPTS